MTIRHQTLTFERGTAIRRAFNDDKAPAFLYWGGREFGWTDFERAKLYGSKRSASDALKRILQHERELGLHCRIDRRY